MLSTLWLLGCGGGGADTGPIFAAKELAGQVVVEGKVFTNALVHLTCLSASGVLRNYYVNTDANGLYRKAVDTAVAPCVADVYTGSTYLFGFAPRLDQSSNTAHINVLTDALLALLLKDITSAAAPSYAGLTALRSAISQAANTAAWQNLRNALLQSKPPLLPQGDALLFTESPDTAALDTLLANAGALTSGAAYHRLLKNLADKKISSQQLQTAVRGAASYALVASSNGDEIIDMATGLVWQRCVLGMVWNGLTCTGTAANIIWTDLPDTVLQVNTNRIAGSAFWRLPTEQELMGLLGQSLGELGVNSLWFPASPADWTWTSTPTGDAQYPGRAVNMETGEYGDGTPDTPALVRLVRR